MRFLSLFLAAAYLFAAPPTTVIQDTVHAADGSLFNGSIVIGWPTFQAVDGSRVQGGSRTVDVKSGAFRVSLPVFDGYTVLYLDGSVAELRETWSVPASATPLLIRDVRTGLEGATLFTTTFEAHVYAEGTVSLVNGSAAVEGTGVAWDSSMAGWYLVSQGKAFSISSVDDAAHLNLTTAWDGDTVPGVPYHLAQPVVVLGTAHGLATDKLTAQVFRNDGTQAVEESAEAFWVVASSFDAKLLFDSPFSGTLILRR